MDSLKDLYLLLEEENMTSPAHQTDKKAAADEQQLNPTIKVDGVTRTHTHSHTHTRTHFLTRYLFPPAVQRCEQHFGRPKGGAAGPERRVASGETRLPGTHPAVRKGQGIMGS